MAMNQNRSVPTIAMAVAIALSFMSCFSTTPAAAQTTKLAAVPDKQTITQLTDAAMAGVIRAQVQLGYRYCNGDGVAVDYAEAAKWFRKAAEQGNSIGEYDLGRCYLQ